MKCSQTIFRIHALFIQLKIKNLRCRYSSVSLLRMQKICMETIVWRIQYKRRRITMTLKFHLGPKAFANVDLIELLKNSWNVITLGKILPFSGQNSSFCELIRISKSTKLSVVDGWWKLQTSNKTRFLLFDCWWTSYKYWAQICQRHCGIAKMGLYGLNS